MTNNKQQRLDLFLIALAALAAVAIVGAVALWVVIIASVMPGVAIYPR